MDVTQIDERLRIKTITELPDSAQYLPLEPPFRLLGMAYDGECYTRIPAAVAESVSVDVAWINRHTAGGRVRFVTDSPYISIVAELFQISKMPHMALSGAAGFDLTQYVNGRQKHIATLIPAWDVESSFEAVEYFDTFELRDLTLNFPLYTGVKSLYIILHKDAKVLPPAPYQIEKPVVFYGSSITQGGCASKPSGSYEAILSDRMDCNYLNLGFSGSAKGEQLMADYISKLDMSAFVLDYDHNAATVEDLAATHEPFFKTIRAAQPQLPVLIVSRPGCMADADKESRRKDDLARLEVVKQTYINAVAAGDKNVRFLNGMTLMDVVEGNATVDKCHPTDIGFFAMARKMEPVLRELLKL